MSPSSASTPGPSRFPPPGPGSTTFSKAIQQPSRAGTVFRMAVIPIISLTPADELVRFCSGPLPDGVCAVACTNANTVIQKNTKCWCASSSCARQSSAKDPSKWSDLPATLASGFHAHCPAARTKHVKELGIREIRDERVRDFHSGVLPNCVEAAIRDKPATSG